MKPYEKYGKPIYPRVFEKLLKIGRILEENNWRETASKPNLFLKKFEGVAVFADMRSTEVIPIWKEPYPMLYSTKKDEAWKDRKALRKASEELKKVGVEYRYSFYHDCEMTDEELDEIRKNLDKYGIDEVSDGSCYGCGKDFDKDGLFCSERCEKTFFEKRDSKEKNKK